MPSHRSTRSTISLCAVAAVLVCVYARPEGRAYDDARPEGRAYDGAADASQSTADADRILKGGKPFLAMRTLPPAVIEELRSRGHVVRLRAPYGISTGIVAAGIDPATGRLRGGPTRGESAR